MSPGKALEKFLDDNGILRKDCQEALGCSRLTLYQWLNELVTPDPENQERIKAYTKGRVAGPWPKKNAVRRPPVKPFTPARKAS
ncbi:MAG TPA: hypothetical protein VHO25_10490 [Polyangiaceae bacterium]|nr:hypothetical protein [Polyangiaceae bacterium]